MLKTVIVGASGYAGPNWPLWSRTIHNSSCSASMFPPAARTPTSASLPCIPNGWASWISRCCPGRRRHDRILTQADLVVLATAHEVSAELAPKFLAKGLPVFDLSGAFRVNDQQFYSSFYGFTHENEQWLEQAAYGLAEWNADAVKAAQLIAVPGCYPTASLCALKPLQQAGLIAQGWQPIINAVSGVSGAGRKAAINTSFCEVSLNPYGTFNHRHQPEISHHLGKEVLFQPHLGNYVRGILATIYVQLAEG